MKATQIIPETDTDVQEESGDMRKTVRSVERIAMLLDILNEQAGKSKGISELSRRSGLAKGTVHRLLITMIKTGFVKEDGDKYCLGLKLVELGGTAMERLKITDVAAREIEMLANQTNLTVHLAMIMDHELLYIGKANSNQSVQTVSYIGQRSYLHSTGLGKSICAFLPVETVLEYIRAKGMPKFTEATITDEDTYIKELAKVRENGYAMDNEENEIGIKCISAPVFDNRGHVIAAISATTISSFIMANEEKTIIDKVKRSARTISLNMGCSAHNLPV